MKRLFLLLICAALLAACSSTRFVYNRLDWFASWQIGKYVDLDDASEAAFESGFAALWQWHRGTQLPLYARDLRELADAAAGPLSQDQLDAFLARADGHADRVLREALPGAARVFQAMDDAQVAHLLKRVAERRAERLADDAKRSPEEQRERAFESMEKNLKRWLGSTTPEQKQRVREWVDARSYTPELWQRYAETWWAEFATLLAARREPEFEARLRDFLLQPQLPGSADVERQRRADNRSAMAMLAGLSDTLTTRQRTHFQAELRALARDLDILVADGEKKAG